MLCLVTGTGNLLSFVSKRTDANCGEEKGGLSRGTEPSTSGACANSAQLALELTRGHPAGVEQSLVHKNNIIILN